MWIIILSALITSLALTSYLRHRRQTVIKRWYQSLSLEKHEAAFQELYCDVDGFTLSRQSRVIHDAIDYTYGEIDFIPFIALLSLAHPHQDTVFYDLGSGTGKAALACAMTFNVRKSCGIELFHALHEAALNQQHRLQQRPPYHENTQAIHFVHADFLKTDLSDATLVFINATAFFGETWAAISLHLTQLKVGATIITTSKKLSSDAFTVTKTTVVDMSWGPVKAYIQQRAPSLLTDV